MAIAWSSGLHPLTGTDEVAFLYMAKGRVAGSPINTPSDDLWVLEGSEGDDAYSEDIDTDRGLKKILISNPLILMVEKDILQPYTAAFFP